MKTLFADFKTHYPKFIVGLAIGLVIGIIYQIVDAKVFQDAKDVLTTIASVLIIYGFAKQTLGGILRGFKRT